jgi:Flp pilus assembly protein TadG
MLPACFGQEADGRLLVPDIDMLFLKKPPKARETFIRLESGSLTVVNIIFLCIVCMLAGVAIDVANVISARTQLQTTADAAAHAALVEREWKSADQAKAKAVQVALKNMPDARYGYVLSSQNIVFGDYDRSARQFTPDNSSRDAVYVRTERLSSNHNPVGTFLLQMVGLWNWDVRTAAIFEAYTPTCLVEGFVAEDIVDIQSNNSYYNGFCIHSNTYVTVNNNNYFEPGTIVSMPDMADMTVAITGNGTDKNEGLDEALREGKWFIKILNRIAEIENGLHTPGHRYFRDYTTNLAFININASMAFLRQGNKHVIKPTDLSAGNIYLLSCSKVDLKAGLYSRIVLIANCPIELSNGVVLQDAVLLTTDTGSKSVYSPAKIVLGTNDACAPGGGAQIVTKGGVNFAAGLEMYGSQIIAGGNVEFSSNANGLQGASIVAGGRIDSTSNMNFAFCGSGMEHSFLAEYFRLAE